MSTIFIILLCVLAGALAGLAFYTVRLASRNNGLNIEKTTYEQKFQYGQSEIQKKAEELRQSLDIQQSLQQQLNEACADLKVARSEAENLRSEKESLKEEFARTRKEMNEEKTRYREEMKKDYETRVEAFKFMFKDEAAKILKDQSTELSSVNSEQMKHILDPLTRNMDAFKKAVEDSRESSTKNTTSIEQQIRSMMEHTAKISRDANNLTEALRSKNKIVGNWGETVLENALDNLGLVKGNDYDLQTTIRDEEGRAVKGVDSNSRLVPDAVVYLPDNKAIVIDSKVSLKSFMDYMSEEVPERKELLLKEYVSSVQTHIKELADKKYGEYMKETGKDALNYVIMFIPNENAFQLFFQKYLDRWHSAFDDGVIVTGEANLFAMLKIVQVVWSRHKQQKEIDNIAKVSVELIERVGRFVSHFSEVGKSLDNAQSKFENAQKALIGRQSVKASSRKLAKMGVDVPPQLLSGLEDPLLTED